MTGYLEGTESTVERVGRVQGGVDVGADGRPRDHEGLLIGDFGLPLNLMLAVPVRLVAGGLPAALATLERT